MRWERGAGRVLRESGVSACVRASLAGERRGRRGKPRVRRAAFPPSLLYFKLPYTVVQRSICLRSLAMSHWHIRSRYTMIAPCLLLNVRTKASLLVFSIFISVSVAFLQLLCFPCLACLPLSFYKFSLEMIKTNSLKSALRFRASDHLCMSNIRVHNKVGNSSNTYRFRSMPQL